MMLSLLRGSIDRRHHVSRSPGDIGLKNHRPDDRDRIRARVNHGGHIL
jgi:hypothetical protein